MDSRLKWTPSLWNGITQLNINSQLVWKPDLVLVNQVGGTSLKQNKVNVKLYSGKSWY